MSEKIAEKRKILCKECQQVTWHAILNKVERDDSNEDAGIWVNYTFFTLQCLGCENVCLLTEYICSEDINEHTGNPETQTSIHPSPHKNDREIIGGHYYIPREVKPVYEETIKAFNTGLMLLATIGVRTTIEAIARQQKITVVGIKTKIEKMMENKIVTPDGAKLLLKVKDVGNISAHEVKSPHRDDLSLCIDVVEGVLRNLYILPRGAEMMRGG